MRLSLFPFPVFFFPFLLITGRVHLADLSYANYDLASTMISSLPQTLTQVKRLKPYLDMSVVQIAVAYRRATSATVGLTRALHACELNELGRT